MRVTEAEYYDLIRRTPCPCPTLPVLSPPAPKPNKYHAVLTECDGIRFQSKKEAAYYRQLLCRVRAGQVAYFLRQVPFHLQGGVKYLVDFAEFWTDGSVHYVDVKGHKTEMYKVKKRLVQASYPVRIEEV